MLPGFENLLFAHSSWYTYAATMRIYKHWDFSVTEPHTATGQLSFSSYPGTSRSTSHPPWVLLRRTKKHAWWRHFHYWKETTCWCQSLDHEFIELINWSAGFLMSLDDFYLLGSGLMMTQTSNDVFNTSLFDTVTPNSLLAWQRVRLAHSLAHTGEEWARTFSRHNSGRPGPVSCCKQHLHIAANTAVYPSPLPLSLPLHNCCRHIQQPVHVSGQKQSQAGSQHWGRRTDHSGADPRLGGILRSDSGSAQR